LSLRDFLETSVFGQHDAPPVIPREGEGGEQQQNQLQEDDAGNSEGEEEPEVSKPPIVRFIEKRRRGERPFLQYLEARREGFFDTEDSSPGEASDDSSGNNNNNNNNPFFSFLDGIKQTRASLLGETEKEDEDEASPGSERTTTGKEEILAQVLEKARVLSQKEDGLGFRDFVKTMRAAVQKVAKQLQDNFGDLLATNIDAYIALAIPYFALREDARNSPLAKRRLHRFYQKVTKEEWMDLHDALYLSQLAYVNTIEQFESGLEAFENGSWKKIYGTTQSVPDLPANFLLIHRELDPLEVGGTGGGQGGSKKTFRKQQQQQQQQPQFPVLEALQESWQNLGRPPQTEVLVTLVVRGTKDFSDLLQDGTLEPEEYRGGYAHGGILASGKNLAKQYLPKLKDLHEITSKWFEIILSCSVVRSINA
jgi:hypothetical protein